MGRRSKFTPEIRLNIINYIKAGNYYETAALASGITAKTFYEWMAKGRKMPASDYGEFRNIIEKAHAEAEARNVLIVEKAAEKSWQAAAWWLERTSMNRWGRKEAIPAENYEGIDVEIRIINNKEVSNERERKKLVNSREQTEASN